MNRIARIASPLALVAGSIAGPLAVDAHAAPDAFSVVPAKYHLTIKFDGKNTVTASARNVGGSWEIIIQQRKTSKDSWQGLAATTSKGKKKAVSIQEVRPQPGKQYDFRGHWRACVTTNLDKSNAKTTCGKSILVN